MLRAFYDVFQRYANAFKALDRIANNELRVELRSHQIDELKNEIRRANRRSIRTIVGGSCIISASIVIGLDGLAPFMIGLDGLTPIMMGGGRFMVPLAGTVLLVSGLYLVISSFYDE